MIVAPAWVREYDMEMTAYARHGAGGTGPASTLPMTEAEMDAAAKRARTPIGFSPPPEKKRRGK